MKRIEMKQVERYYKNQGQEAERVFRYTLTGRLEHADNYEGADCLGIQVKTSKASICKGLDIRAHVASDSATEYAYVLKDLSTAYIMSPAEYIEFIDLFARADHDSSGRNGGNLKLRLKTENREMRGWLEAGALTAYWIDYDGREYDIVAYDYEDAERRAVSLGFCLSDCIIEKIEEEPLPWM